MEQAGLGIPQGAVEALKAGHKVKAVKLTREGLGITLKDALAGIDIYLSNNPEVRQAFVQNSVRSNSHTSKAFVIGAMLVLLGLIAMLFLTNR